MGMEEISFERCFGFGDSQMRGEKMQEDEPRDGE